MPYTKDQIVIIMTGQPDQETCIDLFESSWWEDFTHEQAAFLQFHQDKLCMPFGLFHKYFENLIGRPVYSHEFASKRLLQEELETGIHPTLNEILAQIPSEKLITFTQNN
ncbi:MAG: hypothetical protein KME47_09740 [Nodosilinea sp. WJT8-NPBG4]|nr:hypothetical protein [Nodosilinea sp. WJT8-NPBG4]